MRPLHLPNPEHASLAELQVTQRATTDRLLARRLMAIIMLVNGVDRVVVQSCLPCSESTLRQWISLYNAGGIDALATNPGRGRDRKLSPLDLKILDVYLGYPKDFGVDAWTLLKLWGRFTDVFERDLGYSTFTRSVREAGYRRLVARPTSPEQDPVAREVFLQQLDQEIRTPNQELWYMDESGFLADPRPKAVWAKRGTKPVCPKTGLHIRESVLGAVQPDTGEYFSLVFNHVDRDVFQCFLDQLAKETAGRKVVLVLDNASWHKAKSLAWHDIRPFYLPPYSPDLNPIERLWKYMKDNWFTNWYTQSRQALQLRIMDAIQSTSQSPDRVKSVCRVSLV
jgi:transposase